METTRAHLSYISYLHMHGTSLGESETRQSCIHSFVIQHNTTALRVLAIPFSSNEPGLDCSTFAAHLPAYFSAALLDLTHQEVSELQIWHNDPHNRSSFSSSSSCLVKVLSASHHSSSDLSRINSATTANQQYIIRHGNFTYANLLADWSGFPYTDSDAR